MASQDRNATSRGFTPAAGVRWLTPLYDAGIAVGTRERRWRRLLVEQVRPAEGDLVVDVGCGTGSLLVLLGRAAPGASLVGIDPDPEVLRRAAAKAAAADLAIEFLRGFAEDTASLLAGRRATKAVSSLVFHQVPLAGKEAGLAAMRAALEPGGEVHIADYGLQRTLLMRCLFGHVQLLDGRADTEPNARGALPGLMRRAGFGGVAETAVVPTPTGSISLYRGRREDP